MCRCVGVCVCATCKPNINAMQTVQAQRFPALPNYWTTALVIGHAAAMHELQSSPSRKASNPAQRHTCTNAAAAVTILNTKLSVQRSHQTCGCSCNWLALSTTWFTSCTSLGHIAINAQLFGLRRLSSCNEHPTRIAIRT